MLKTIRSKRIIIMALILLLTAVVIIYLTHRDVGREIMHSEQQNVGNVMDMVFLNIQGVYRGLIPERINNIEESKDRLKRETGIVLSGLDLYLPKADLTGGNTETGQEQRFLSWLDLPPGMVLGGMEDSVYQTWHLTLAPGDKLLMYMDEITEAMNSRQELYSDERLRQETQGRAAA